GGGPMVRSLIPPSPAPAVRFAAPAAGIVLDRWLGEPPMDPHPVAAFGSLMDAIEKRLWADRRDVGAVHAAIGLGLGLSAGALLRSTVLTTYTAVAGRALDDAAARVEEALRAGDLVRARERLPALVGRDPEGLDETE